MIIKNQTNFYLSNHVIERLAERIKQFYSDEDALEFCRKALVNRELSYTTIYDGISISVVHSDDLVFILDTSDFNNISIITVYTSVEKVN